MKDLGRVRGATFSRVFVEDPLKNEKFREGVRGSLFEGFC
jgi:hypothetical protein